MHLLVPSLRSRRTIPLASETRAPTCFVCKRGDTGSDRCGKSSCPCGITPALCTYSGLLTAVVLRLLVRVCLWPLPPPVRNYVLCVQLRIRRNRGAYPTTKVAIFILHEDARTTCDGLAVHVSVSNRRAASRPPHLVMYFYPLPFHLSSRKCRAEYLG